MYCNINSRYILVKFGKLLTLLLYVKKCLVSDIAERLQIPFLILQELPRSYGRCRQLSYGGFQAVPEVKYQAGTKAGG